MTANSVYDSTVRAALRATKKMKARNYYTVALHAFLTFFPQRGIESLDPESIELTQVGQRDLDLMHAPQRARGWIEDAEPGATIRCHRHSSLLFTAIRHGMIFSNRTKGSPFTAPLLFRRATIE